MAILGFDIDDTVADGNRYFVKALNEYFNKDLKYEDVRGRLNVCYGVDQSVLDEFFKNLGDKFLTELKPIDGAVDSINKLYDAGHQIIFITARHENNNEATKRWLAEHNFKYHKLIHSETKVQECLDEKIDLFVDDHPTVIQNISKVNIPSIFVDLPKNVDIAMPRSIYIWRAKDFNEINKCIEKILNSL